MFRIYIKAVVINIFMLTLISFIASCAYVPSSKKSTVAASSKPKAERSAKKVLAQPKFRISKKTASAYNEALKHMRDKNYDTAIVEMQKVAEMDKRISGPWVNIGMAQKELGNAVEAKESFYKAISINAKNPYALNQLGIMNREDGKYPEAEKLYKKALAAYPDYQNAHLNLAILCDVYLRKIACARDHYQEYLNLTGEDDKQVSAWIALLEEQGG